MIGQEGILTKTQFAKEKTRGVTVDERVKIWKAEEELGKYTDSKENESITKLIEDLLKENLITKEEKKEIQK